MGHDGRALKRSLLRLAIVALCVVALLAMVGIATGEFGRTEANILATHAVVAVYTLFALASATMLVRRPSLAYAGFASSAVGLVLAVVVIWGWQDLGSDLALRSAGILLVVSFTLAHAALIESRRRDDDGPAVRAISTATVVAGSILAVFVVALLSGSHGVHGGFIRVLGMVAVADALGTILLPIIRKMERSERSADAARPSA